MSASALVLRLRQQRAARAAAREAPDALERKTVALDGDHVQRARAVRLVRVRVMARVRAAPDAASRAARSWLGLGLLLGVGLGLGVSLG